MKHGSLETLVDDIDEGGMIDSEARLQPGDLTDELWKSGFAMFLHLAYCPDTETETWAKFYEETLARSPVRSIIEKVAAVTRTKTESSGLLTTEVALFGAFARVIPLKVSRAALVQSCKMLQTCVYSYAQSTS